jgi:hypothetical protein
MYSSLLSVVGFGFAATVEASFSNPKSGDQWSLGQSQSIDWDSSGLTGPCDIHLVPAGATDITTILEDVALQITNSGSYSWTPSGYSSSESEVELIIIDTDKTMVCSGSFWLGSSSSSSSYGSGNGSGSSGSKGSGSYSGGHGSGSNMTVDTKTYDTKTTAVYSASSLGNLYTTQSYDTRTYETRTYETQTYETQTYETQTDETQTHETQTKGYQTKSYQTQSYQTQSYSYVTVGISSALRVCSIYTDLAADLHLNNPNKWDLSDAIYSSHNSSSHDNSSRGMGNDHACSSCNVVGCIDFGQRDLHSAGRELEHKSCAQRDAYSAPALHW